MGTMDLLALLDLSRMTSHAYSHAGPWEVMTSLD